MSSDDTTQEPVYMKDLLFYRVVVISLGAVSVLSVIALTVLGIMGKEVPDALVAVGSGGIGAIAGLFK